MRKRGGNAVKTQCSGGHWHPSKLEAGRCDQLLAMEEKGEITHLVQQPQYPIIIDGRKVCTYIADWSYRMADSGLPIVADAKGKVTAVFSLKKKLVEACYPGVIISVWPPKVRKKRTRKAA